MSAFPKVSVIIPVYNREEYVGEAVDSILAQGFEDFELLAIDDGSTDRTPDILGAYADPRIRVVRNDVNQGVCLCTNKGFELARGAYVALLDSDDRAHPDRLERQVAFLDGHPRVAVVGSWFRLMDAHGRRFGGIQRRPLDSQSLRVGLLFGRALANPSTMYRGEVLRHYRCREHYGPCFDLDLWARIAHDHDFANIPEPLVDYRRHSAQITREKEERIRTEKLAIYARQLGWLGLDHDEEDLERHYRLVWGHLGGVRFRLDEPFLDWADAWLERLCRANLESRYFCDRALAAAAGRAWFNACRRAAKDVGVRAWWRFAASPHCRHAWPGTRDYALARIGKRLAPRAKLRPAPGNRFGRCNS